MNLPLKFLFLLFVVAFHLGPACVANQADAAQSFPDPSVTFPVSSTNGLKVSDNRRYFVDAKTGAPVFILADTAWNLGALKLEEVEEYLNSRASHGFNTVMFALNFFPQAKETNAYGHAAYLGANKTELNPAYFEYCDAVVRKCAARGLYVMLYAMWAGPKAGTMNNYTAEQLHTLGRALGERYRGVKNVILCAGGEATPHYIEPERVNAIGSGLKAGCAGENLVTVHPVSGNSTSKFYADSPWLDFYMSQGKSGSGPENVAYDAAALVAGDFRITSIKPTMMAEHRYESGTAEDPLIQRRSLYQCVFAGGFGYGYGHNALWQMTPHTAHPWMLKGWNPGVDDWRDALDTKAVRQFQHIKTLLYSHPYLDRIPDQSLVRAGQGMNVATRVQATRDGTPGKKDATYLMAYLSAPQTVTLDTSVIAARMLNAYWFNPATGASELAHEQIANPGSLMLEKRPKGVDWVVVIEDATKNYLRTQRNLGAAKTDAPAKWGDWPSWGDQSDGTYRNPVLPADFSDIDCIRVGSDYYAISSTMQFSPGMAVIHSKDLVNWQILSHVVSDLTQIGPELNWDRMNRYGKGIWAGAIRHHAGKFWVYFGTPDEGYFMSSSTNAAGPWAPLHQMTAEAGWDDCCPFWDDDGQGYFVGTNFRDGYKTWLYKLTPAGRDLIKDSGKIILEGRSREASKLYKFNGYYYHFFSENKSVGRYVMMQRATNIFGPYAEMKQLTHGERSANQPNQGGIVQTEKGDWYFYTHHGTGDWEGRCNSLLPVTWRDGWPVPGEVGADGIGRMVWSGKIPVSNVPVLRMQTSDEFNAPKLPPQWEWNYQPRAEKWSLTERPGWLRLHAFQPLAADNLLKAGNTLTQRTLRTATNTVVVKLDLSGMADGQKAGLCHFALSHSALGVTQVGAIRQLEFRLNGALTLGPVLTNNLLWVKSTWGLAGRSQYAYSLDGVAFTAFGEAYQFDWGHYRGNRVGLYSFNNQTAAGHVDVDWFHHDYAGPGRWE